MTEATDEKSPALERVNMMWPPALKEAVKEKVGGHGITKFAIGAVESRLADEDRVRRLEKEVGELRYLAQLLADRVAMGGDHQDRSHLLMEVELPSWMKTEGWPEDMRGLVPITPPVVTKVGPAIVAPGQAANEVVLGGSAAYSDEELAKPAHQVAAEKARLAKSVDEFVEDPDPAKTLLEQTPGATDVFQQAGDDLFERVKAKAAEKGVDVSGAGLVPASKIPKPDPVHNHSWERTDGILCCECGAWIDNDNPAYPQGIVREAGWAPELPTEPAPALEVQTPVPTPVAAPAFRDLSDIEDDF